MLRLPEVTANPPTPRWRQPQVLLAVLGFLLFAAIILSRATVMLEPDDYAYRASIVALSHGHILLSESQMTALSKQLTSAGSPGILQWHHLASGKWISEKNPGYPFFAVVFYLLHILRATPLFYGALACAGLYFGARKWLGGWAGTYVVWIYCFSGAAVTFAWRDTMPSFTDASLVASGFGALLWVYLSPEHSPRRRLWVGLAAFASLEGAVFIRYTNIIELVVATLAVCALAKQCEVKWSSVAVWLSSLVLFATGVLAFDQWAYGSATSTGYAAGEISFSWSSLWPNLKGMPRELTTSMPMWIIAFVALITIAVKFVMSRRKSDPNVGSSARRDAVIAGTLALGWLGLWILYFSYTWTASMVNGPVIGGQTTVHVIRFYLPVLGLIALLATWLVVRLFRPVAWIVIASLLLGAVLSFVSMSSSHGLGPSLGGRGPTSSNFRVPSGAPLRGGTPGNGDSPANPGPGTTGAPTNPPPGSAPAGAPPGG